MSIVPTDEDRLTFQLPVDFYGDGMELHGALYVVYIYRHTDYRVAKSHGL